MRTILLILKVLWASPYTLIGLAVGLLGLISGGRVQVRRGVVEFHGGLVRWLLAHGPRGPLAMAITFGHTVLGQSEAALDLCRTHEQVHVRQYELWGPVFGPAYVLCSLGLWLCGRDGYRDNPFERQARRREIGGSGGMTEGIHPRGDLPQDRNDPIG